MTLLEIMHRKQWISDDDINRLNQQGMEIAAMIKGLINAIQGKP